MHPDAAEVWYQENNVQYQVCGGSVWVVHSVCLATLLVCVRCTSLQVCSATNGEDPSCSDSLPLPISGSDHTNYLGVDMSMTC